MIGQILEILSGHTMSGARRRLREETSTYMVTDVSKASLPTSIEVDMNFHPIESPTPVFPYVGDLLQFL